MKKSTKKTIIETSDARARLCANSQNPREQLTEAKASLPDLRSPTCSQINGSSSTLSQERFLTDSQPASHTFSKPNKKELAEAGEFPSSFRFERFNPDACFL